MPIRHLGYVAKNLELENSGIKMQTVRRATFDLYGEDIITEKILHNLNVLYQILEWNIKNDIYAFRLGSELFPWLGNYNVKSFKRFDEIEYECSFIGEYARENNIRLSFHPGPFNVLCSPDNTVVEKTIRELEAHSEIFDLMGYEPSFNTKINIHVGGAYGDKVGALEKWVSNYYKLSESLRQRLVIENDDTTSMYSVQDLYGLHELCNNELPITFDYYHHSLHQDGISEKEALDIVTSTWPKDIVPVTHYSESRREEHLKIITDICRKNGIDIETELPEWPTLYNTYLGWEMIKENAHSDNVNGPINTYGHTIDVMLEAKAKEQALLKLREKQLILENTNN